MRLGPECIGCLLSVRLREIALTASTREGAIERGLSLVEHAVRLMRRDPELTRLATSLYRYTIKLSPGVVEHYRRLKKATIEQALSRIEKYRGLLEGLEGFERFVLAAKIAIAGNTLDSGVAEHKPGFLEPADVKNAQLAIDHTAALYELASRSDRRILYLLDNAGEAVFDSILIRELERLDNRVVVAVKSEPGFQNDVTIKDVRTTGLARMFKDVVETGTSASSIHLDEVSSEFKEVLDGVDVIVAKGMSHYEYLSEARLGKPVFFMLIPKCTVVSEAVGVPRGSFVVLSRGVNGVVNRG